MRWLIYNFLFFIGYLIMLPKFIFRMIRRGGYAKDFTHRFGIYSPEILSELRKGGRVWVHAVSVGEVMVASRFIEELEDSVSGFVLTTTTSTGYRVARKRLGDNHPVLYFPADFPCITARVLGLVMPTAIVLTESEFWPNLIRMAHARGIPLLLINGRISLSSYRGYRLLKWFFQPIFESFSLLLVQTEEDRLRLARLGARNDSIHVAGSVKYDVSVSAGAVAAASAALEKCGITAGNRIIVGGSTWPGEEETLLRLFARIREEHGDLKLVLIPRHAERRDSVEREIKEKGFNYRVRSRLSTDGGGEADVLLVDVTGEMTGYYEKADVVFVGKSLTATGGQNIIEPAALAKPVIVGPNTENFEEVVSDFLSALAILRVANEQELEDALRRLLESEDLREQYGSRARETVKSKQGVVAQSARLARNLFLSA